MNTNVEAYCIGWWNIRMQRSENSGPVEEHILYVVGAIRNMITLHGLELLFLGEIDADAVKALRPHLKREGFRLHHSNNEPSFNMAIAYNAERMNIGRSGLTSIIHLVGDDKRKVAQMVDITLADKTVVRFYCLHWPSRLYNPVDSARRSELANYLRDAITRFRDRVGEKCVVILGDFNDEPSDLPLMKLLGTRDVQLAQKKSFLFYNPFWKFLINSVSYSRGARMTAPSGTYYYSRGQTHKWHVLDQMLFSSCFFGKSDWYLAEAKTTIFEQKGICEIGPGRLSVIDHLPILATIERMADDL